MGEGGNFSRRILGFVRKGRGVEVRNWRAKGD